VDADVRDMAAGGDDFLAGIEAFWETDGFDSNVNPSVLGEPHDCFRRPAVSAADDEASSPLHRQLQTILIAVNHDDLGRRVELRCEQRRQSDWTCSYNRDGVARLYFAIQDAALEPSRENVAQHNKGFLVCSGWDRVDTVVRVRNADVFGLSSVDLVPENPTSAILAV